MLKWLVILFVLFCKTNAYASFNSELENLLPVIETEFDASDVSCTDNSTLAMAEKTRLWKDNPDGDIYLINHSNEILAHEKQAANSGNQNNMYLYGIVLREMTAIYIRYIEDEDIEYLPEKYANQLTMAFTYVYLSSMQDGERKDDALNFIRNRTKIGSRKIPETWIVKAKANAEAWQNYCER